MPKFSVVDICHDLMESISRYDEKSALAFENCMFRVSLFYQASSDGEIPGNEPSYPKSLFETRFAESFWWF